MALLTDATTATFPAEAITAAIESFWSGQVTPSDKNYGDPFGNPRTTGGTVFDTQPSLDSLRAVEVLLELEPIIGIELRDDVIKLGGYDSCDEMVNDLLPKIRAIIEKANKKK